MFRKEEIASRGLQVGRRKKDVGNSKQKEGRSRSWELDPSTKNKVIG